MNAHTPGPWLIGRGGDGYPIVHTAPDSFSPSGQGIAHVCKRAMCQDHTANARLISAAPETLAALRDLYNYARRWPADDGSVFHVRLEAAAAAIAKATGGTA